MKQTKPRGLVLFQDIYVRWSKASRGAPGAIARNRVPEAVPLPANPPSAPWPAILVETRSADELALERVIHPDTPPGILPPPEPTDDRAPDLYLHFVVYDERNQFRDPLAQRWYALVTRLPESCMLRFPNPSASFTLAGVDDKLQVRFPWGYEAGKPRVNIRHLREEVLLAAGQWVQLRGNRIIYADGLNGPGGTRFYSKVARNIGVADAFKPTLFIASPPDYQIRGRFVSWGKRDRMLLSTGSPPRAGGIP